MSNTLKNTFIFCLGAGVGSFVTWKLLQVRYEQMVKEDVASVKEAYSKRMNTHHEDDLPFEFDDRLDAKEPYVNKQKGGYTDYSKMSAQTKEVVVAESKDEPYVIAPEVFGENHDYQQISLTYYSDGVLTDEDDDPVENIEETIGRDSLNHFGEYEDDSVFVRNDALKAEYEILLDQRKYADVRVKYPHKLEE